MNFQDEQYLTSFYFDEMLRKVDENEILQSWESIVRNKNIPSEKIQLHQKVICRQEFLTIMKTQEWRHKMQTLIIDMASSTILQY